MNSLLSYKKEKIGNQSQFLLIEKNGIVVDSCESLFETADLRTKNVALWCPFMESIFDFLITLEVGDPEVCFSRVEHPSDYLRGFYDFGFSKILFEGKELLLWQIHDYTHLYKDFMQHQQSCNELLIKQEKSNDIQKVLQTQRRELSKRFTDFQHLQVIKTNYYRNINSSIPFKARIGAAHQLKRKITDRATIEYIDAIEKSLNETKHLVEELMILTNAEEKSEFQDLEFDIYHLLNEVSGSFECVSKGKEVQLNIAVHKGVPEHMIGNYIYLKHLISGLLANYAKLIGDGSINMEFDPMMEDGRQLIQIKFDLTSNLKKVLPIFSGKTQQLNKLTKPVLEDVKTEIELRLSILRKFVEQHHGHFSIQNDKDSSAGIAFSFPFKKIA